MKTMLELLIRLLEMRCCCEHVQRNRQFTNGEKGMAWLHKQIVRECLPREVLTHYDRMKKTEHALLSCPEMFAMAVLVSTYRNLSPLKRKKLIGHFVTPALIRVNSIRRNERTKGRRCTARRFRAGTGDCIGEPWPR
jgi:hypothetical protein